MAREPGLFDIDARLGELSAKGDALERVNALVDFEAFRAELEQAVPRADRSKGGRPPYDHVLMFRILMLQASHSLSDERTEYLIKDRLSFMRFLGLSLADRVPDANSIWTFREALTRARIGGVSAIEALFRRFEAQLSAAGYIAMGGQIVDATVVAAPKQRNTEDEKRALKEGRIPEAWAQKPAKLAQKDRDARWTVKYSKAKPSADGAKRVDIAIPMFGYKNHVGIDRRHGLIRTWTATRRRPPRRRAAAGPARQGQHRQRGLGRHRVSLGEERGASRGQGLHQPDPPQEAHGQAHAEACLPRQCRQVGGPCPCRARLRPPEGPHGAGRPHHRAREGDSEDRAREPRLQHAPHGLARRRCPRLTPTPPPSSPAPSIQTPKTPLPKRKAPTAVKHERLKSALLEVSS
jgi:IS5 family transposase